MSVTAEILTALRLRLEAAGLRCLAQFPPERARRWDGAAAVLGLRALELGDGGFGDYLGMETDARTQARCEVYGKRGTARLGLDVYCSPEGQDAAALCEAALATAVNALLAPGENGLGFRAYRQGEAGYDTASGLYRVRAELDFDLYLSARAAAESAEITDFRLGDVRVNV